MVYLSRVDENLTTCTTEKIRLTQGRIYIYTPKSWTEKTPAKNGRLQKANRDDKKKKKKKFGLKHDFAFSGTAERAILLRQNKKKDIEPEYTHDMIDNLLESPENVLMRALLCNHNEMADRNKIENKNK